MEQRKHPMDAECKYEFRGSLMKTCSIDVVTRSATRRLATFVIGTCRGLGEGWCGRTKELAERESRTAGAQGSN